MQKECLKIHVRHHKCVVRHHKRITRCFPALQHQFRSREKSTSKQPQERWDGNDLPSSHLVSFSWSLCFLGVVAAKVRDRVLHSRHLIAWQWDAQCFLMEILCFLPLLFCLVCVTIYVTVVLLLISKLLWNSLSWIISQNSKCCFCWQLWETSQHCITQNRSAFYSHSLFLFPSLFFGLDRKQ